MENRSQADENNSSNVSDIRNRCNEATVELRESEKDDQMNKHRNIVSATLKEPSALPPNDQSLFSSLEEIILHMKSDDPILVYRTTQAARKILCQERSQPIKKLIELGIVPICVGILESRRYSCIEH